MYSETIKAADVVQQIKESVWKESSQMSLISNCWPNVRLPIRPNTNHTMSACECYGPVNTCKMVV